MKRRFTLLGLAAITACHHAASAPSMRVAPCYAPYPPPPAGVVRIDGPGAFGPHAGDSLVVRVDDREHWRGVLQTCARPSPGLSIDFTPWQAAGDTLDVVTFDRAPREKPPITWVLQLVTRAKARP